MIEIYGTLGPACSDVKTLASMLEQGLTGMRLNLSHVTLPQAADQVAHLHTAAEQVGVRPKLLIDLQGPELRIGVLPESLELHPGDSVILGEDIPVPMEVLDAVTPGQELLLDDGKLLLTVEQGGCARVLRGGVLQSRKSIAAPGLEIHLPALTGHDLDNLAVARDYGVTGIMQPFVRCREDLETVRSALDAVGAQDVRIYAKIESQAGMQQLSELLPAADEIVVARGDLGNAMPLWELPGAQKHIAAACREAGKPFMVVTQMLASMEHSPVPTRAEVSDIFNAVLDGASSVMVTGETAVGEYPVETIRYLSETVHSAERYLQNI